MDLSQFPPVIVAVIALVWAVLKGVERLRHRGEDEDRDGPTQRQFRALFEITKENAQSVKGNAASISEATGDLKAVIATMKANEGRLDRLESKVDKVLMQTGAKGRGGASSS